MKEETVATVAVVGGVAVAGAYVIKKMLEEAKDKIVDPILDPIIEVGEGVYEATSAAYTAVKDVVADKTEAGETVVARRGQAIFNGLPASIKEDENIDTLIADPNGAIVIGSSSWIVEKAIAAILMSFPSGLYVGFEAFKQTYFKIFGREWKNDSPLPDPETDPSTEIKNFIERSHEFKGFWTYVDNQQKQHELPVYENNQYNDIEHIGYFPDWVTEQVKLLTGVDIFNFDNKGVMTRFCVVKKAKDNFGFFITSDLSVGGWPSYPCWIVLIEYRANIKKGDGTTPEIIATGYTHKEAYQNFINTIKAGGW